MTEDNPYDRAGETIDVVDSRLDVDDPDEFDGPKYQHEEWLYQQYAILGKTLQEIADDCGAGKKTIWRWVQEFDIDTRSGGPRPGPWKEEGWLRGQYLDQQKSIYQIADEQDCDEKTIRNWLAEHGIETRDYSDRHPASREQRKYRDEDWLRTQYVDVKKTAATIADDCDVSRTTIYRWLDRHSINTRSVEEARQITESRSVRLPDEGDAEDTDTADIVQREGGRAQYKGPETGIDLAYQSNVADQDDTVVESPYRDEEWLRNQYERTGSTTEIAELCGVDRRTITYWMEKFGIERSWGDPNARYRDEAWLREAYDDLGTLEAVAEECDVSRGTIGDWMDQFGIERDADAVSGDYDGRSEKTLEDLLDALVELYEQTGEWVSQSTYDEKRSQLSSAPSTSWFYDKNPGGLSSWDEAVEMAKRRYSDVD
jgi:transposase